MEKTLKKSLLLTLLLPMMAGCTSSSLLIGTISGYEQNKTVNGKDINARLQSLVELRADSTAACNWKWWTAHTSLETMMECILSMQAAS